MELTYLWILAIPVFLGLVYWVMLDRDKLETKAEREWNAYQSLRDELSRQNAYLRLKLDAAHSEVDQLRAEIVSMRKLGYSTVAEDEEFGVYAITNDHEVEVELERNPDMGTSMRSNEWQL